MNKRMMFTLLLCMVVMGCEPSAELPKPQGKSLSPTPASRRPSVVATPKIEPADKPFEAWSNEWHQSTPLMRDRLAEKIVSESLLLGENEDEVEVKLGKPDFRSERLIYRFDFGQGYSDASLPSLMLNLDCTGQVVSAGPTSYPRHLTPDSFDEQRWKHGSDNDRFLMAPALTKSKRLIGMTRESAVRLLGEPTLRAKLRIAYDSRPRTAGEPVSNEPNRKLLFIFDESYNVDKAIYTKQ